MRRDFQIRITDEYGEEEVFHYKTLAEANEAYAQHIEHFQSKEEEVYRELELIEVLSQHTTKNTWKV